jgi:fumarate reductase flavoprotein subunit
VQRAAGITDSADDMYQYMMTLNQWSIKPALAKHLADGGSHIIDWLIELGNEFPPHLVIESGVDGRPRGHQAAEAGYGIVQSLVNAIGALGVEVALGSRVSDLLFEDGRVVGIRAGEVDLRAHAVIVTTGGFANNPDMVKRLWPTAAAHGTPAASGSPMRSLSDVLPRKQPQKSVHCRMHSRRQRIFSVGA